MGTVTLTTEEYAELLAAAQLSNSAPGKSAMSKAVSKATRKGKAAKGLGRAMKEANDRLRTKSGKLRKGKTQADVARLAHKIRRKKYA